MDRGALSPVSQGTASSPPSSPSHEDGGGAGAVTGEAPAVAAAAETTGAAAVASATASPASAPTRTKKIKRKKTKRKAAAIAEAAVAAGGDDAAAGGHTEAPVVVSRKKKPKKKHAKQQQQQQQQQHEKVEKAPKAHHNSHHEEAAQPVEASSSSAPTGGRTKKIRKKAPPKAAPPHPTTEEMSAQQKMANEQMRRVLEEDQYSANGSIVETDSENEDNLTYRGEMVRMDRTALMAAMRKHLWMERLSGGTAVGGASSSQAKAGAGGGEEHDDDVMDTDNRRGGRKKKKGRKRAKEEVAVGGASGSGVGTTNADELVMETSRTADAIAPVVTDAGDVTDDYDDRDGGSIFGQTTGSSNATWVECDKCKKWRRLRGVVDEKKLPARWYCAMNKNDPERARCSAPEEEYDTHTTPESAADARTRKHLRVWVRRLQCNEAYESRQPTLTRGRKRATSSTAKEPYEWIRCCNQSCGKWRAILRIMDAKTSVMERTQDGEWYCVMNTWDEKTASCAAPQENLPAIGCPTWVNQDEK